MKHFIDIASLTRQDAFDILDLAQKIRKNGSSCLDKKSVALIFEKPSNRTRLSLEVGIHKMGGQPVYVKGEEIQIGYREPVSHISRVMSRYFDMMVYRTNCHQRLVELAEHASIPVINGLSNHSHPCQAIADVLTIMDQFGSLDDVFLTYIGDGNNVCHSLMNASEKFGFKMAVVGPKKYLPKEASKNVIITSSLKDVIKQTNVVYTDVWVSMGDESESRQRLFDFKEYQVNSKILKQAREDCMFLHCLPANIGQEVTNAVLESPQSKVFDQAENRMHAQNAIMSWLL